MWHDVIHIGFLFSPPLTVPWKNQERRPAHFFNPPFWMFLSVSSRLLDGRAGRPPNTTSTSLLQFHHDLLKRVRMRSLQRDNMNHGLYSSVTSISNPDAQRFWLT